MRRAGFRAPHGFFRFLLFQQLDVLRADLAGEVGEEGRRLPDIGKAVLREKNHLRRPILADVDKEQIFRLDQPEVGGGGKEPFAGGGTGEDAVLAHLVVERGPAELCQGTVLRVRVSLSPDQPDDAEQQEAQTAYARHKHIAFAEQPEQNGFHDADGSDHEEDDIKDAERPQDSCVTLPEYFGGHFILAGIEYGFFVVHEASPFGGWLHYIISPPVCQEKICGIMISFFPIVLDKDS